MTNEELFEDLKQFVPATVSQSEERLRHELSSKIDAVDAKVGQLQAITEGGFNAAAQATDEVHTHLDDHDRRLEDHERQLQNLRHKAA